MMEYTNKYWNMLMPFIKKSLNKRYGKMNVWSSWQYGKLLMEKFQ